MKMTKHLSICYCTSNERRLFSHSFKSVEKKCCCFHIYVSYQGHIIGKLLRFLNFTFFFEEKIESQIDFWIFRCVIMTLWGVKKGGGEEGRLSTMTLYF